MLPFAFAVAAQTVVVIAGGIDLSIASMMALTSVTAGGADGRRQRRSSRIVVVPLVLLLGLVLGAINGALIVITRVPDIVVTLAMLFVWQGAALLVLDAPGGAAADWLQVADRRHRSRSPACPAEITAWIPQALVLLVVCLAAVSGFRSAARGSACRSTPSAASDLAAFRSGVAGRRAPGSPPMPSPASSPRWAGWSLTMSTGIGAPIPGPYLLASVAAVVLGGVALGGGRGGLVGPIVAVFILRLVRTDLTLPRGRPQRHHDHRGHDHGRRRDARRLRRACRRRSS